MSYFLCRSPHFIQFSALLNLSLICWHSPNLLSLPCDPLILSILCLVFMITSELMIPKHIFYSLFWISGQNIQKPPVSKRAPTQHIQDGTWLLPKPLDYFLLSVEPTPVLLPRKSHGQRSLVSMGSQRVGHDWATSLTSLSQWSPHSCPSQSLGNYTWFFLPFIPHISLTFYSLKYFLRTFSVSEDSDLLL